MLSVLRQVAEVTLLLHLHECLLASLVYDGLDDGVDFTVKIENIPLLDVLVGIDTGLSLANPRLETVLKFILLKYCV